MRLLPNSLRKALTGIALCCVTATAWAQETLPYWKDIQTVGVNREPARTAFMTYENLPFCSQHNNLHTSS